MILVKLYVKKNDIINYIYVTVNENITIREIKRIGIDKDLGEIIKIELM